jgi:hypothetical protein
LRSAFYNVVELPELPSDVALCITSQVETIGIDIGGEGNSISLCDTATPSRGRGGVTKRCPLGCGFRGGAKRCPLGCGFRGGVPRGVVFGGAVRGGARLAAGRPARSYSETNIAGYGDNRFLKFDNDCKLFDKRSDSQTQFSTKKQGTQRRG